MSRQCIGEHVPVLEQHLARRDDRAGAGVPEQRRPDRGLAGAGLADQADDLSRLEDQVDVVDDVDGFAREHHAEVLDDQPRDLLALAEVGPCVVAVISSPLAGLPGRCRRPSGWCRWQKMAMTSTGARTAQGWVDRASRFSWIIWPQLAAPGLVGEPEEAQGADEADRVGEPEPALGQQRRVHVRQHLGQDHPGPLLAERLGRDHEVTGHDAERDTTGQPGDAWSVGDTDQDDQDPARRAARIAVSTSSASRIWGNDRMTSLPTHDDLVPPAAAVRRDDADRDAQHHAEQRAEEGDDQDRRDHRTSPGSSTS